MQIFKRKRMDKLPLQANYYPGQSAMLIQDENLRLMILPVLHMFRLVLEIRESCTKTSSRYPVVMPSYDRSCTLRLQGERMDRAFAELWHEPLDRDIELAAVKLGLDRRPTIELVVQWTNPDFRSVASGERNLSIKKLLNLDDGHEVYASPLTQISRSTLAVRYSKQILSKR